MGLSERVLEYIRLHQGQHLQFSFEGDIEDKSLVVTVFVIKDGKLSEVAIFPCNAKE